MRLFFECRMGASGDMMMAALYELLPDKAAFREKMQRLALPGVAMIYSESIKCGIAGTHISVSVGGIEEKSEDIAKAAHSHGDGEPHTHSHGDGEPHSHSHSTKRYSYKEIQTLIRKLALPDNVLKDALGVYKILAEAEAAVHGTPLDKIHLHEVGAIDAVADIVGCCLLINMLALSDITASPVHVGSGSVRCEHGILPVPAPATAEILKGVPIYGGSIDGELCTPTGAALLRYFAGSFGNMPPMVVSKIGCGMGTKDFPAANCLRAFLCEDDDSGGGTSGEVFELSCNLDDMTPEAIGAAYDILFDNGALDVYSTPIMMKKSRPAVMLSCLCEQEKRDLLTRLMLLHTSTLGVRVARYSRSVLTRGAVTVKTKYGDIRVKRAHGFGAVKSKPEYSDVVAAAKRHGIPFSEVYDEALKQR
ncbi:MAG: nickel pincer cofactor biosynthesis protein LarC [Oscillospiraceae bacterium]|nr:nickel pincer cofactor biosynthesis protein LarC [Oscillospiraceae bacterium]